MENICAVKDCELVTHAKLMCNRHYIQMKRHKRVWQDTYIENIDGEEWRDIEGHKGYMISNMGRIKSILSGRHKLLAINVCEKPGRRPYLRVSLGRKNVFPVAGLVAKAFCENKYNDESIVYIDQDPYDCRARNLAWIGTYYYEISENNLLIEAKESDIAERCLRYMHGDDQALDDFFELKTEVLRRLASGKNEAMIGSWKKSSVDIESVVNEALIKIFQAIRRGLLRSSEKIDAWCWVITRNLLCNVVNRGLWEVSMIQTNSEGEEFNVIDVAY